MKIYGRYLDYGYSSARADRFERSAQAVHRAERAALQMYAR